MRIWPRTGASALLLLAATGAPAPAGAEPERVRIQFAAPQGCSDEAAFLRALRKRTGRFRLPSGAEQTRTFVATVSQAGSSVSGRLEIQGRGTELSLRNVSGKSCEEVVAALAFMTALAIDPSVPAESTPTPASPAPTAASSASPPSTGPANGPHPTPAFEPAALPTAASATAPLVASPATSRAAERQASNQSRAVPPPELAVSSPGVVSSSTAAGPPVSPRWKWAAGAAGQVSFAVSPTLGTGGSLFVETAAPGTSVLGPVLRAGLFVNQSDVTVASGAGARFRWAAARVEGCPVRLAVADARLALHPCLAFHLGFLRGEGRALDHPETTTDLWSDLGPVARIRLAVFAHLFLELEGMLVFPLRRLTFAVQDQGPAQGPTTVFSVPRLGALAGMGVAYELR